MVARQAACRRSLPGTARSGARLTGLFERCLGIYQRHSYDAEKREAWRLLGERLELLTRGDDNIVTLKPRRKPAAMLSA